MATKPAPAVEQFYTIPEVAKLLGIGRTTVYELIAAQKIAVRDVGSGSQTRLRIAESDLAAYQASTKVAGLKPGRAA
jgi:excisionase family DNA binding protein